VINLHLIHTSYFLFVMIITLFCYAIIKGRPAKVKVIYAQCPSDKVSRGGTFTITNRRRSCGVM
jgi:hypothetical protein